MPKPPYSTKVSVKTVTTPFVSCVRSDDFSMFDVPNTDTPGGVEDSLTLTFVEEVSCCTL